MVVVTAINLIPIVPRHHMANSTAATQTRLAIAGFLKPPPMKQLPWC